MIGIYDVNGKTIASGLSKSNAEQIVREHNAHDGLVDVLKSLRDAPYGLKILPKLSEHACAGTIRDTWIPRINAALAQAEVQVSQS